jgi:hypothetical protein
MLTTGGSIQTTTGSFTVQTPNAGYNGGSGSLNFITGKTTAANSGSVAFSTGRALKGHGGDFVVIVGSGTLGDGGDANITAGDSSGGFVCQIRVAQFI